FASVFRKRARRQRSIASAGTLTRKSRASSQLSTPPSVERRSVSGRRLLIVCGGGLIARFGLGTSDLSPGQTSQIISVMRVRLRLSHGPHYNRRTASLGKERVQP